MNRRLMMVSLVFVGVAAAAVTIVRCDASTLNTSFSYIPHERPRVFISHHPLRAMPGQRVTIRLAPDPVSAGATAHARIKTDTATTFTPLACTAESGGTFACPFDLPAGNATYVYDGQVNSIQSRTYRFRAAATIGPTEALALREPLPPNAQLAEASFRLKTVWIRDAGDSYGDAAFHGDVERAVYEGILADPVYRWRDSQLAFYEYGSTGNTTSYYSGFDTRCGQNPWPELASLPAGLGAIQVLGLMHRHPNTTGGTEGTVTSTSTFRDCAGIAVRAADVRTFSSVGTSPLIAKHEYGHAAFGLGDEYAESDATRNAPAAAPLTDNQCCCMEETGGGVGGGGGVGTTTGGGGAGTTGGTGAGTTVGGGPGKIFLSRPRCIPSTRIAPPFGLSACSDQSPLPASCAATPQAACPSIFGNCVTPSMWLGQPAPAGDVSRFNSFSSEASCEAARAAAMTHPGVEDRNDSADSACRQICGGSMPACPCGDPEAWIVDKSPAGGTATPSASTDTMGTVLALRHGATCAWCVDSSLCVRWERARGRTPDEAWASCQAPPIDAASQERSWTALLQAIADWIARYILF